MFKSSLAFRKSAVAAASRRPAMADGSDGPKRHRQGARSASMAHPRGGAGQGASSPRRRGSASGLRDLLRVALWAWRAGQARLPLLVCARGAKAMFVVAADHSMLPGPR